MFLNLLHSHNKKKRWRKNINNIAIHIPLKASVHIVNLLSFDLRLELIIYNIDVGKGLLSSLVLLSAH